MAKRNRNITSTLGGGAADQQQQQTSTFRRPQPASTFHVAETGSSSQSNGSYKQLKYSEDTTDTGTESNGGTPPKMQTLSAAALSSNGTSTTAAAAATTQQHNTNGLPNGFATTFGKLNGFGGRQQQQQQQPQQSFSSSSFRQHQLSNAMSNNNNNNTTSHFQHHNPVRQIHSATVMPTTNTTAGHYSVNLAAVAATTNQAGNPTTGKKSLLDLSRITPQHPMSSSSMPAATSPIHSQPHPQLGSSSAMPTDSPMSIGQQQQQQQHSLVPRAGRSPTSCLSFPSLSTYNDSHGLRELLSSLALMCILSLLTSFLALFFLQRSCPISLFSEDSSLLNGSPSKKLSTSPSSALNHRIAANAKEYMRVYQISISLSTLTLCFDLCCLFVCCIQFLSIVKLMKSSFNKKRVLEFVKKTSQLRILAIGAYLVSIPIFFTGVILFTFVNFDEIPALITSIVIGVGIIFCGIAAVQNVYLWQWEKTKASEDMQQLSHQLSRSQHPASQVVMLNTSARKNNGNYPPELSTLV